GENVPRVLVTHSHPKASNNSRFMKREWANDHNSIANPCGLKSLNPRCKHSRATAANNSLLTVLDVENAQTTLVRPWTVKSVKPRLTHSLATFSNKGGLEI